MIESKTKYYAYMVYYEYKSVAFGRPLVRKHDYIHIDFNAEKEPQKLIEYLEEKVKYSIKDTMKITSLEKSYSS